MARYILSPDGNLIADRRATPRYDVAMAVAIEVGADRIEGVTTNLSEAGVQVLTPVALPPGAMLDIVTAHFRGRAEPTWSREDGGQYRTGFRFVGLSDRDREALLRMLDGIRNHSSGFSVAANG